MHIFVFALRLEGGGVKEGRGLRERATEEGGRGLRERVTEEGGGIDIATISQAATGEMGDRNGGRRKIDGNNDRGTGWDGER